MNAFDAKALRTLASSVSAAGEELWRAGVERRARWLARAFERLSDPGHALGRAARDAIPASTGLSPAMVEWALESTLAPLTAGALLAVDRSIVLPHAHARRVRPGQLCVLVLAGNVFTAAARGAALPLLLGWPVLAKASSRDDAFPRLLEAALAESAPELGDSFRVVTLPGDDDALTAPLFEQADAVSAYGSDRTLNAIRARLGATISFIPHGHGLGAAFIGERALASLEQAQIAARELAFDVAAYDQRGCLSPLVAWAVRGAEVSLEQFGELVHAALGALREALPRGPLPLDVASAQISWRGVGAMRGRLLEGDGFAVSVEEQGALRLSPGYRNLQLLGCSGVSELCGKLAPLGVHLKCLGVAGLDPDERAVLMTCLPPRVAPRVCALGTMQLPPPHGLHDGAPAWEGLLRWAECDG